MFSHFSPKSPNIHASPHKITWFLIQKHLLSTFVITYQETSFLPSVIILNNSAQRVSNAIFLDKKQIKHALQPCFCVRFFIHLFDHLKEKISIQRRDGNEEITTSNKIGSKRIKKHQVPRFSDENIAEDDELGELEREEVKGFMDMGFTFKKENMSRRIMSLIPGL